MIEAIIVNEGHLLDPRFAHYGGDGVFWVDPRELAEAAGIGGKRGHGFRALLFASTSHSKLEAVGK